MHFSFVQLAFNDQLVRMNDPIQSAHSLSKFPVMIIGVQQMSLLTNIPTQCQHKGMFHTLYEVSPTHKTVLGIEQEPETLFLDSLTYQGELWTVDINVMDRIVTLRIDLGADVTLVSQAFSNRMISKELKPLCLIQDRFRCMYWT